MTVDREQVKRDAETEIQFGGPPHDPLADHCLALLAELEKAETLLYEKEGELAVAYGGGRTDAETEWFSTLDKAKKRAEAAEARLAKVPALVETLRVMASDGDDWAHTVATKALAEWERE